MDAFAALADPVRRDLLVAVAGGPMRVVDLAAGRPITRPAVSRHLRLLVEAGLVQAEDRGRERHYRLQPQALGEVHTFLDRLRQNSYPAPLTANALDALDTEVRRTERDRRTSADAPPARPKANPPREDIA
ncbi:ArsR/SmtB family transcription factor [Nakamurella sp. GG22]